MNRTIAFDFDGVIHKYSKGWDDGSIYDVPMEDAFETLQKLHDDGYEIIIYGCRCNNQIQLDSLQNWMNDWQKKKKCGFPFKVAVSGKPMALAYVDDKAIRFTNWKDVQNYFI